eukprot:GAHX01000505.1.p1 GENE.GAHX01000505.1~~GAHX01000505.1.p1  ORF type:complete len:518 (-),score=93.09 GAHX01000505.1:1369-2922(-)
METFRWSEVDAANVKTIEEKILEQQTLTIPNLNADFTLHTDASEIGIGAVLSQDGNIVRLFSAKLNETQGRYSVMEKEAYAIVAALKSFKNLIWNSKIKIFTDNKNFTFDKMIDNKRAQKWKLGMSEYDYTLNFVKGNDNLGADGLSRNLYIGQPNEQSPFSNDQLAQFCYNSQNNTNRDKIEIKVEKEMEFLTYSHKELGHPGINKLTSSLKDFFKIKALRKKIATVTNDCLGCQRNKSGYSKIGGVQGYIESSAPLSFISSDFYGPISLDEFGGQGKGYFMTITDVFSRFSVIRLMEDLNGTEVVRILEEWIRRFQVPDKLLTDQGRQYTSGELKKFCDRSNILHKYSTAYNPTGNSLSERINSTIGNIMRIMKGTEINTVMKIIERNLNWTTNRNLNYSPEQILTGRSPLDPKQRTQHVSEENLVARVKSNAQKEQDKTNSKRQVNKRYELGENVLVKKINRRKLDSYWSNPWKVTEIAESGNCLWIERHGVSRWVNIKNVKPYRKGERQDDAV